MNFAVMVGFIGIFLCSDTVLPPNGRFYDANIALNERSFLLAAASAPSVVAAGSRVKYVYGAGFFGH